MLGSSMMQWSQKAAFLIPRFLALAFALMLFGCSNPNAENAKPGSHFVGEWSNEHAGGGLVFTITADGNHYLVKQSSADNGVALGTEVGQFENGFLIVNETGIGTKIFYSETEDALIFNNSPLTFRRRTTSN